MSRLVRLYPSRWRDRYAEEFEALIAERPPSLRDRVDILRCAVDAHRHLGLEQAKRVSDRSGFAAILGLTSFVVALSLASVGPIRMDAYGSYREGEAALPFFFIAFVLLATAIGRLARHVSATRTVPHVAAWVGIVTGLAWSVMPWVFPLGLAAFGATLVFAVAAHRAGAVPAWAIVAIVAGMIVPVGLMTAMLFLPWYAFRLMEVSFLVFAPLGLVWLAIGGSLLRGFPPVAPEGSAA